MSGEGESVNDATPSTTLQRCYVGPVWPHNIHKEGLDLRDQKEEKFAGVKELRRRKKRRGKKEKESLRTDEAGVGSMKRYRAEGEHCEGH